MNWKRMTDQAIVDEMGRRVKQLRLQKRYTQKELAQNAGVNINTIQNLEYGRSVTLSVLIQVLRALKSLDQLDYLIPEVVESPMKVMERELKPMQRVRKSKNQ
ncbi:helix-turn-helix domain-containing protein [Roseivirga sp.]|uniref:helix-turn-helix domain-containing protein n=1 Tax=Roseivirga sp. TaxID=1964215 RepID=UPI002B26D37D|nr:helix-turn-helix domain-containing protein [Roseivirga sp.]